MKNDNEQPTQIMNNIKTILSRSCATAAAVAAALLTLQQTASAATLVHRYNFDDDGTGTNVTDLVGGAAWNGTIPSGGDFASITNQLILSLGSQQYVQFPSGILSNYTAVTIDMWATFGNLPNNCFGFAFGFTDSGGGGGNCIFLQPKNGRVAISGGDPSWQAGEQNAYFSYNGLSDLSGQTVHLTAVINPPLGRAGRPRRNRAAILDQQPVGLHRPVTLHRRCLYGRDRG